MESGKQRGQREEEEERGSLRPEGAPQQQHRAGREGVRPAQALGSQARVHMQALPGPACGSPGRGVPGSPFLGDSPLGE